MRALENFEICEQPDGRWLRLKLIGELDLTVAPVVETRLDQLRRERRAVRLDLSELDFMDGSGLHLVVQAVRRSISERWSFEVDPHVAAPVMRLFRLAELDQFVLGPHG